jgi:hypothetical protein
MKEHNAPILSPGEKVHVMHRRHFEKDARRHFGGEAESCEQGIARAAGYGFVVDDLNKHRFVKRPERRTKLIPISSGEVIVKVISASVDLAQGHYELKDRARHVTDGKAWRIGVKEFGWG